MEDKLKQFGLLDESESFVVSSLEEASISLPVLALPRAEGRYKLYTDACKEENGVYYSNNKR